MPNPHVFTGDPFVFGVYPFAISRKNSIFATNKYNDYDTTKQS